MQRLSILAVALATLTLVAVLGGCSKPNSQPADAAASGGAGEQQAKIQAELAKLSPEDRELASAQETCPISHELLGTMGVPIKVTVDGQSLFVCCAGCEDELEADFATPTRFSRQKQRLPFRAATRRDPKRLPTASGFASPCRLSPRRRQSGRRLSDSSASGQRLRCCPASRKRRGRGTVPPTPSAGCSADCETAAAKPSGRPV